MRNTEELTKDFISSFLGRTDYEVTNIFNKLNWRKTDLGNWEQSKTVWKEVTGYLILKDFLRDFHWNEDTVTQKQGVDFTSFRKKHDLKALVGNYHNENNQLCITVELEQYKKQTLATDKLTEVLAYTVVEDGEYTVVLIPYKKLLKWLNTHKNNYKKYTSNNGSGLYIKVPISDLDFAETFVRGW